MKKFFHDHEIFLLGITMGFVISVILILLICLLFSSNFRIISLVPLKFIYHQISFIADIVKSLGLISIIFVCLNYRKSLRWKRFDYSIKVIDQFRSLIPKIANAEREFPKRLTNHRKSLIDNSKKDYFKKHPDLSNNKNVQIYMNRDKFNKITHDSMETRCFYLIMNRLEELSIYDEKHIIDDKLVYRETHKVFLEFFKRHKTMLNNMSSRDASYSACHYLIRKWKHEREHKLWKEDK